MSGVMEEFMRLQELGLEGIPNKHLCVKHIHEPNIKSFIRKNYKNGHCDYCNKKLKVITLQELMEFMMKCIKQQYDDAANYWNYDTREGGYNGPTFYKDELIEEELNLKIDSYLLTGDIVSSIVDKPWANGDTFNNEGYDMVDSWDNFKNIILHNTRYFFHPKINKSSNEFTVFKILNDFRKLVRKFHLIRLIDLGTIIYRCRQHENFNDVKQLSDIVSAPNENAIHSNRFSPAGISMLYGAYEIETAKEETLDIKDKDKLYFSVGKLKLKKNVAVLDLTKLPNIPSLFDLKKYKNKYKLEFLNEFRNDLIKPISRDGKEHLDYVPTQVISEFLKFEFSKKSKNRVEGILYKSSKNDGTCLVLFWDNTQCLDNFELIDIFRSNLSTI